MIVTVIAVRMMQVTVDQIVDVVAMRHGLMTAAGSMHVPLVVAAAVVGGRACLGILLRHLDHVLIHVTRMRMMKMSIVEVVHVVAMLHSFVAASRPVLVLMIGVMRQLAIRHLRSPFE